MTTATQTRKPRKTPQAVHGVARWVGGNPTQARLDDGDAILQITAEGKEAAFYFVETNKDASGQRLGFRLVKIDGLEQAAMYDLEARPDGFRCDCPDAEFCDRPGGCKHCAGLKAALAAAKLL